MYFYTLAKIFPTSYLQSRKFLPRWASCAFCIFQAFHRIFCGNNFDGLTFLHTARFFSKVLLWVILTRWTPCAASRLNIVKLNAGSIITFHKPSKANSQSINTLQFPFKLSQNAIKIYQEFTKHNFSPWIPYLGVSQETIALQVH